MTVTALLERTENLEYIVNFEIEGQYYPTVVRHGETAVPPYFTPAYNSQGEPFIGWDKPLDNITQNTTIMALFASAVYYTVTFDVDGRYYYTTVKHGDGAVPPVPFSVYEYNGEGKRFLYWSVPLDNITRDTVVTAVYEPS
jgi:hypothetical protein